MVNSVPLKAIFLVMQRFKQMNESMNEFEATAWLQTLMHKVNKKLKKENIPAASS